MGKKEILFYLGPTCSGSHETPIMDAVYQTQFEI
jgi:hypothetical protein